MKRINRDMSVQCENGIINIRVGAIILKDGKLLMVGNNTAFTLPYHRRTPRSESNGTVLCKEDRLMIFDDTY